ncbi:MAG: LacI family DNA-binding transcriptional regulator [Pleomorphochaeta sp.]
MSVKLKDIANEAGVSISTVSRILSNDTSRKANKQTVEKVNKIALEMGYFDIQSNKLSTITKKTKNIGCVFTSDHESFVSPFFSQILSGIQEELYNNIYNIDFHFFTFNLNEFSVENALSTIDLDGAVILGRTNLETINQLKSRIKNLVYCGINTMDQGIDEVCCSAYEGVVEEVKYLSNLGHTNIGYIGPTNKQEAVFNEHRFKGFCDGLEKYNLELNNKYVKDCYLSASEGYKSIKEMYLENSILPSAIICGNDIVAMGVLKALQELKISIPNEISVVGFDNVEESSFTNPSLTTINVPKVELGRVAVKILLDKINKGHKKQLKVAIPFSLIERESSRSIK